jgi:hypothetical protein
MRRTMVMCLAAAAVLILHGPSAAGVESPARTAAEIDQRLAAELDFASQPPAANADDATFLRRAFLDLTGYPPTPDDVLAFLWDDDPLKREQVVQRLLADDDYGQNWAAYWRDVILYRRSEERALIVSGLLNDFLAEQFNRNAPWNEIAAQFITAEGDVSENGATAVIMAQAGQPEDTVAEISRIFLGIQIQCAQCHDHPTDQWKREQFHQLAAFFPRVAVRPDQSGERRTFRVVVNDGPLQRRVNANNRFRGTPEHFMPNLNDPEAQGTLMQPVFFATGDALPTGSRDAQRRSQLAQWLTSPDNPWFAKAMVNRLWSELCGEGFYEPVDDLGPDRKPTAPQTLEYLSGEFIRSDYDVKWLFATIMATEQYQRASAARRGPEDPPFRANVAQPLRADALLNSLLTTLAARESGAPAGGRSMLYGGGRGTRGGFNQIFGYDPSVRRDEISATIPQAQALMNASFLSSSLSAQRGVLAQLLRDYPDNESLISQLYLRSVSRLPTEPELQTCVGFIRDLGNRGEAAEDVLWSLINSTEYSHRR